MKSLILVSTLGQARTAAVLVKQEKLDAEVCVLYTKRNTDLLESISLFLEKLSLSYQKILLPFFPTVPSPTNIRKCRNIYRGILDADWGEVWVSNRNTHYRIFLELAKQQGIKTCFFEDGLSSYKDSANHSVTDAKRFFMSSIWQIGKQCRNFKSKSYLVLFLYHIQSIAYRLVFKEIPSFVKFLSAVLDALNNEFFQTRFWKVLATKTKLKHAGNFYELSNGFDRAAFVFPKKNVHVLAKHCVKLNLNHAMVPEKISELSKRVEGLPKALYISQSYGKNHQIFYKLVARFLKEAQIRGGGQSFLIKFHPRESEDYRGSFKRALKDCSVLFQTCDLLETSPVEDAIATKHFSRLYGISSTAMLYAQEYCSEIEIYSIGMLLADQLDDENLKRDMAVINDFGGVTLFGRND